MPRLFQARRPRPTPSRVWVHAEPTNRRDFQIHRLYADASRPGRARVLTLATVTIYRGWDGIFGSTTGVEIEVRDFKLELTRCR